MSQSRGIYYSPNDISDMVNQIYILNFMLFKQKYTNFFIRWVSFLLLLKQVSFFVCFQQVSFYFARVSFFSHECMKIIFCIEYENLLRKDLIFANTDETMLNNHTKRNYFWANRGKANTIKIIFVSGSLSFIAVITSKGD